jgi:hypothetical protein
MSKMTSCSGFVEDLIDEPLPDVDTAGVRADEIASLSSCLLSFDIGDLTRDRIDTRILGHAQLIRRADVPRRP